MAFRQLRASARGLRGKELGRGGGWAVGHSYYTHVRGGEEGNNHFENIDGKAKCITAQIKK